MMDQSHNQYNYMQSMPAYHGHQANMPPMIPPGLQSLYEYCVRVYPDQPNPLQVTAVLKYWLGGPDPLDYISMYSNDGNEELNIPPHWHYISFGLSDLHGDGRVHALNGPDVPSGFGFELTFRLKREPEEQSPPTWPAAVMQSLAKYVFQSNNTLCAGDHVSWHCSLDNSESRIQHMLMTEDPQLQTTLSPFGRVTFIQIVGVCLEELKAAQQWNGPGIVDLLKSVPVAGGSWLVTDMRRGETIFEVDPELQEAVDDGIATEGSNLSGVSAKCSWNEKPTVEKTSPCGDDSDEGDSGKSGNELNENNIDAINKRNEDTSGQNGLSPVQKTSQSRTSRHSSMSVSHDHATQSGSRMSFVSETGAPEPGELIQTKFLNSLHLKFNLEAGNLLPLAFRGRLKHGRHFTFKSVIGDLAITFVTPAVEGAFVTCEQPYAIHGPWLQVLIRNEAIEEMLQDLEDISDLDVIELPKTYNWPDKKLSIELLSEEI